jgi:hypothetical protein
VEITELSDWTDVIIVSTKGERSAANILSGGGMFRPSNKYKLLIGVVDYDGGAFIY